MPWQARRAKFTIDRLAIVAVAALILLFAGPRLSRADEAFCKAYSAAAMQSQLEATRANCGFAGGFGRWSENERDHYQSCLTWGATTSRFAIGETNTRAQELSACKARKLGTAANPPLLPYAGDIAPAAQLGTFCMNYARLALGQIGDKVGLGCAGLGGPRWDPQGQHHVEACMNWSRDTPNAAGRLGASEMNAREVDLLTCRRQKQVAAPSPPAPPPPPPVAGGGAGGAVANHSGTGDAVPPEWADMLAAHNERRKLHCAPPLTWSNEVAASAQAWADSCTLDHQANDPYGENFMVWSGSPVTPRQGFENSWYCEVKWYDFANPKIIGGKKIGCDPPVNGHFTQVVWKDTRKLGCASKVCNGQSVTFCRYDPPGNFNADKPGVLAAQVHAASSACNNESTTADNTPSPGRPIVQTGRPRDGSPLALAPFAGNWKTDTDHDGHYLLALSMNGNQVSGTFTNTAGDQKYNGTLTGTVNGNQLRYTYVQPAVNGKGSGFFVLLNGGAGTADDAITGSGTTDDAAQVKFKWTGRRQ